MGWGAYNAGISVVKDSIGLCEYANKGTTTGNSLAFTQGATWYYIAFVISDDSTLQALYVNGQKVGNLRALHQPSWSSLWLGVDRTNGYNSFNNGTVDEMRISNIARTSSEIALEWSKAQPVSGFSNDSSTLALWRFDDATGSTFENLKGGSGTLYGGYTWIDGRFGKAIQLDGTSGYGNCNINPPENNCTYEIWYKPIDIANNKGWITMGWGAYNAGISVVKDSIGLCEFANKGTTTGNTLAFAQGATWYYIAFVISDDSTLQALYVNGVKVGSLRALHQPSWSSLWLGVDRTNGYNSFNNGSIDEFRISNRARTAQEITAYWNNSGSTAISFRPLMHSPRLSNQASVALCKGNSIIVNSISSYKSISLINMLGRNIGIPSESIRFESDILTIQKPEGISRGNYMLNVNTTEGMKTYRTLIQD
jgi:hypothetical protein